MTAQPDADPDLYEVNHRGSEAAAIVPPSGLRRRWPARSARLPRASAEMLEEAEVDAILATYWDWVAIEGPGAALHEVEWRNCSATT